MTRLRFLGTGTSQGVPIIACQCPVCKSRDPRDKRFRSAAFVEYEGLNILIDAGPSSSPTTTRTILAALTMSAPLTILTARQRRSIVRKGSSRALRTTMPMPLRRRNTPALRSGMSTSLMKGRSA